jgi:homospermidine synthase
MIKAGVAVKKRKEDLAMLLVDRSGMNDDVRMWCTEEHVMILSERRAPPATQPTTLHHR